MSTSWATRQKRRNLGVPALHGDVSVPIGILIEAVMTFILVFVIFQVAVDENGPSTIAPIAIGMTITLTALMSGPLTGAALNPARAFGPALVSGYWTDHYVYWIGPLLGGGIGGASSSLPHARHETPAPRSKQLIPPLIPAKAGIYPLSPGGRF